MSCANLRILVVLPLYGGSLPIGRYCTKALRSMGYNVREYDSSVYYSAFSGLKGLNLSPAGINALENSFLRLVSQGIFTMAQEQQSQIVLALAQAPLDKLTLKKMRNEGMATVMWFVEDYKVLDYWRYYAPLYDAFAVIQKEPFISELAQCGQPNAFYLPLAALPDFHKPTVLDKKERNIYGSDISFLGAGYPNRRLAFRQLGNRNFKIWGSDWDGESVLKDRIQKNGARISEEESVKIYNASTINLNLHSSVQAKDLVPPGDFVNPRTFELAAMGAFQLVDKRSLMPELFDENELATFSTVNEMIEKIDHYLKTPEERKKLAQAARARVLKDHTYEKRMEKLIRYMDQKFGPFTKCEQNPAWMELPEKYRQKIEKLCSSLGLPANASFKEVTELLRRQKGSLSELETAILFLDEWRKQYKLQG